MNEGCAGVDPQQAPDFSAPEAVTIAGWGTVEGFVYPKRLMGLRTRTTECMIARPLRATQGRLAGVRLDVEWRRGVPKFICIEPLLNVGGPCLGDFGGEPSARSLRYCLHLQLRLLCYYGWAGLAYWSTFEVLSCH